jgi:hypothetical protein
MLAKYALEDLNMNVRCYKRHVTTWDAPDCGGKQSSDAVPAASSNSVDPARSMTRAYTMTLYSYAESILRRAYLWLIHASSSDRRMANECSVKHISLSARNVRQRIFSPHVCHFMFTPLCATLSYSSGFLETLDEGSFFTTSPAVTPSLMPTPTFSQATPYISNSASAAEATSNPPVHPPEAPAEEPLLPSATKTEKFLLTAADQESGTRDERLSRVIWSKYEAGLLKPCDYVKGYARLSRWMDRK